MRRFRGDGKNVIVCVCSFWFFLVFLVFLVFTFSFPSVGWDLSRLALRG